MSTLGELLRSARESKGFSIEDVAGRTKIRSSYIERLEENSTEGLPQPVFIKGFLRNLARLYGLEAEEVLARFDDLLNPVDEEGNAVPRAKEEDKSASAPVKKSKKTVKNVAPPIKKPQGSVKANQINRPRRALAAVFMLMVLAAAVYFGATWLGAEEEPAEEFIPMEEPAEVTEPLVEPQPETEPVAEPAVDIYQEYEYKYISPTFIEGGLDIMLKIAEEADSQCWISVSVDGAEEYSATLKAGDVVRFFGNEWVQLTLGDAGVVSIFKDGEDTGFQGEPGQVVYKDFLKE